jgi:hypothetical protein
MCYYSEATEGIRLVKRMVERRNGRFSPAEVS